MNIQIIGTKKCQDTNKAIRYFKERRIPHYFVDLNERALSKGELSNISRSIKIDDILDKNSKEFKRLQLEYKIYDIEDVLLNYPLLIKTPIIRLGNKSILGFNPDAIKQIINQ